MKSDPSDRKSKSANARSKRVKLFASFIRRLHEAGKLPGRLKILDIGGTVAFWHMNAKYMPLNLVDTIEIVNIPPITATSQIFEGMRLESYAGNALEKKSLRSTYYDIVHSNSVIEHVGNLSAQKVFAENVRELAAYHFIQTPCLTFPIEPHFYFPFFSLLPLSVRTSLHHRLSLGYMGREKRWLQARINCEETRLLSRKELRHLFQESECLPEWIYMMIKSWMVTNMAGGAVHRAP